MRTHERRDPRAWLAALAVPWRKVLRDLWNFKTRTVLIVLSIAVGVFAVGAIAHMNYIVSRDLAESYASIGPADAVLYPDKPFDDELVQTVRHMDGVGGAQGRQRLVARFRAANDDKWYPVLLFVIPDYEHMTINRIEQEIVYGPDPDKWRGGTWPPPDREIVFERTSLLIPTMGLGNSRLGDSLVIEMPDGKQREMRIAGLCYDFGNFPATFGGMPFGYITFDTLEWLGEPRTMNELDIRVTDDLRNKQDIKAVADQVEHKLEKAGYAIPQTQLHTPGEMPLGFIFQAITVLLAALGAMALFLSVFLIVNSISAHVGQQVRQIGIMKAIGARTHQIAPLYLGMTAIFGALAILIAIPAGLYAAEWFVNFMAYFLNFKLGEFSIPPTVILFEITVGLGVPLAAALLPILGGTRVTVRQAIGGYGLSESKKTKSSGHTPGVRRLPALPFPRPLLLSLRNTFRRRMRLTLTLLTLVLAGTIFIGNMNINASLSRTLDSALGYFQSDLWIILNRSYPLQRAEAEVSRMPGIVKAEGWGGGSAFRVRPDGTESANMFIYAPPASSQMIRPIVVDGRWLLPEDENAIVISTELLKEEPDLDVGDSMVLKFAGRETSWQIVGLVRTAMMGPVTYANYPYFARTTRDVGNASIVFAVTERHDAGFQTQVSTASNEQLPDRGIEVNQIQTTSMVRDRIGVLFTILFTFLMTMTVLMAAVGGLGLMGTMSLNVLERTREIGVLRAIGASNGAVMQMVIVEGVLIGVISWACSAVLAIPLGKVLGDAIGVSMLQTPLDYAYSIDGALLWLALVVLIGTIASYLPARNASRLTVREVLAYE